MASLSSAERTVDGIQCYETKRAGHSAEKGRPITPWVQHPLPLHQEEARFSTPPKYYPPHLERLRADLAAGRAVLPKVSATVSAGPSPRVRQALGSLKTFDSIDSPATAYDAQIAAGPDHLLVVTNYDAAVMKKTDGTLVATLPLMTWFSTVLPAGVTKVFDPRVLYDQHDDRWVLVASGAHYPDFTSGVQLRRAPRILRTDGGFGGSPRPWTGRPGGQIIRPWASTPTHSISRPISTSTLRGSATPGSG